MSNKLDIISEIEPHILDLKNIFNKYYEDDFDNLVKTKKAPSDSLASEVLFYAIKELYLVKDNLEMHDKYDKMKESKSE